MVIAALGCGSQANDGSAGVPTKSEGSAGSSDNQLIEDCDIIAQTNCDEGERCSY